MILILKDGTEFEINDLNYEYHAEETNADGYRVSFPFPSKPKELIDSIKEKFTADNLSEVMTKDNAENILTYNFTALAGITFNTHSEGRQFVIRLV